jgi:hypothetical protein
MAHIFIAHSEAQRGCADRVRGELEALGYSVWREEREAAAVTYARKVENGVRGSAAVVVIWSASAAADEWVEREIMFAQQLKKPLYTVLVDDAELSILLVAGVTLGGDASCAGVAEKLLPHLPPASAGDEVQGVAELLAHERIAKRRQGIEAARSLLERARHREELLALLEDVARKEIMQVVREEAQAVIDAERERPVREARPDESRHTVGVRCPKGHVTYFDKRILCTDRTTIKRGTVRRAELDLAEMYLRCETCGEDMVVRIDCEPYV